MYGTSAHRSEKQDEAEPGAAGDSGIEEGCHHLPHVSMLRVRRPAAAPSPQSGMPRRLRREWNVPEATVLPLTPPIIRWPTILLVLGYLLLGLSGALLLPLWIAWNDADSGLVPLAKSFACIVLLGAGLVARYRRSWAELNRREAIFITVAAWFLAGVVGALPYYLSPHFGGFVDAWFESVSGFTTTGASILVNVELLPSSLQFWRAFTQWLGGLGLVLLMIAFLPRFGAGGGSGGLDLFRAEFSGAGLERPKPQLRATVRLLLGVYTAFTIAGIAGLMLAGLGWLDACCHSFAAIATGGFSTRGISVEAFDSLLVEAILIVLMVLGGINFYQHCRLLTGGAVKDFFRDPQIFTFLSLMLGAVVLVSACLFLDTGNALGSCIRVAAFQVASIMATTGFSSTNFDLWHPFAKLILVASMFAGGCTGSTAGGLKSARVWLMLQAVRFRLLSFAHPRAVQPIQLYRQILDDSGLQRALAVVLMILSVHLFCSLLLCASGLDLVSSVTAAAATMFSVGPGLGSVGPYGNYAHLTDFAKLVLVGNMIAGRLEIFPVLVLFTRWFWRP